jgi:hypothetical protein
LNLSPCREAIPFTGATVVLAGFPIRPVAKKSELQSCREKMVKKQMAMDMRRLLLAN